MVFSGLMQGCIHSCLLQMLWQMRERLVLVAFKMASAPCASTQALGSVVAVNQPLGPQAFQSANYLSVQSGTIK